MENFTAEYSFKGKVVVITGGTMGIGEGCARVFCAAGASVVICARDSVKGLLKEKELNALKQGECIFRKCDVSSPEEIKNLIEFTIEKFGRLDCLINNAGWHPPEVLIDDISIDDFKDLIQLNLVSIFAACKYALPHLRKTKGNIINIGSLVGSIGQSKACSYVTTKSAITGLTKALAIDESKNEVRVNTVSPASIATPLTDQVIGMSADPQSLTMSIRSWHQLNRQGTIEEVGEVCLFLASRSASFLTGVDIPISGGAELGYGSKFQ